MFISYWDGSDFVTDYHSSRLVDKNECILTKKLLERIKPELSTIEIETINRCNNDCSFCPANRNDDIRQMKKMDDSLFKKIVNELSEMNYQGRVSLFSNDEPLLDGRILSFVKYAKEKLPNAFHSLYTNGILINENIYKELVNNLDYLRINNYNDKLILNDNIKRLVDACIDEENCFVEVEVRKKTQVLQNRGGLSPNNSEHMKFESPCILPYVQMVIRPDGLVSRCCQDVYGNETMGSVFEKTIKEIFEGERYEFYRKAMMEGRRNEIEYCKCCDMQGLVNRYPNEWEFEYYQALIKHLYTISKSKRTVSICCVENGSSISTDLLMLGIKEFNLSYNKEDLSSFLNSGDYVVWGGSIDYISKIASECNRIIGEDFLFYSRNASNYTMINTNETRKEEKEELLDAEEKGRLILFGAGITAKRIVNALGLKKYHIVDNKKAGACFTETIIIDSPEKIQEITNPLIVIAVFNPSEIIKQLNDMGYSTKSIRLGYRYLR